MIIDEMSGTTIRFYVCRDVRYSWRMFALIVAITTLTFTGCGRDVVGNSTNDADGDGYERIIDCDDTDPAINPDADEIPYDGVDQNCDGDDYYDPGSFEIAGARGQQLSPHVEYGSSSYLVIWRDARPPTVNATYGQLVTTDGSLVGHDFSIHENTNYPKVAFDGENFLVVFSHFVFTHSEILGQLVSQDGHLVGGVIPICTNSDPISVPDVAFGGDRYLVAWREKDDSIVGGNFLYSRIVHTDGSIGEKILVQERSTSVFNLVESDGRDYLVIWRDIEEGGDHDSIIGQVVLADGTMYGAPITISNSTMKKVLGDIAFDGTNYLIVFSSGEDGDENIQGQFVSSEGNLLYTNSDENMVISDALGSKTSPMMLYAEGFYLVAWRDHRWDPKCAIYSQKVATDGALIDTTISENKLILAPQSYPLGESVASDGRDAILVWLQNMEEAQEDVYGLLFTP